MQFRPLRQRNGFVLVLALTLGLRSLSGCAGSCSHSEIRWVRSSTEYQVTAREVYRMATVHVREAAGRTGAPWGVVLDADETILDNSAYQLQLAGSGQSYPQGWDAWIMKEAAPVVPGAKEFLTAVRNAGGKIIVVTNRLETQCRATHAHFNKLELPFDLIWCKPDKDDGKAARFRLVQAQGVTLETGGHVSSIVAWVGDSIADFPSLGETGPTDTTSLARFGVDYFMIPNPMYGPW